MAERKEHPVLWGLLALVTVSAVVGLMLGVGALAVTRLVGLGGSGGDTTAGADASMYLPEPEPTETADGAEGNGSKPAKPAKPRKSRSSPAATAITLTAGQSAVGPMQRIDLTGSYPGGDGAILGVQRFEGGNWVDFPVSASVSDGTFSTYVQTGRAGVNRFRVIDSDSGEASNDVKVIIG